MKLNIKKLEKAVLKLEMKSNYVSAEYYHDKFIAMSKLLEESK